MTFDIFCTDRCENITSLAEVIRAASSVGMYRLRHSDETVDLCSVGTSISWWQLINAIGHHDGAHGCSRYGPAAEQSLLSFSHKQRLHPQITLKPYRCTHTVNHFVVVRFYFRCRKSISLSLTIYHYTVQVVYRPSRCRSVEFTNQPRGYRSSRLAVSFSLLFLCQIIYSLIFCLHDANRRTIHGPPMDPHLRHDDRRLPQIGWTWVRSIHGLGRVGSSPIDWVRLDDSCSIANKI